MQDIESVIAKALNIDPGEIEDDTGYQSIAAWDSFAHVNLMLHLSDHYGIEISNELILDLSDVRAIKAHISGTRARGPAQTDKSLTSARNGSVVHRGLAGVTFDRSRITSIDGHNGRLSYRGYDLHDLAAHASFEETAWLLLEGGLPTVGELRAFSKQLASLRAIPDAVIALLAQMRQAHPMDALVAAIALLGAIQNSDTVIPPLDGAKRAGLRLMAQLPVLIATHHSLRMGRQPLAPDLTLSLAADFLRMLQGHAPDTDLARMMDKDLIVHADHSSNAATFGARVAIGCGVDITSAIVAALSVFKGPLHGGAVEHALRQLDEIGKPERAAEFVRRQQAQNLPIMGFGHRVYRTEDPRVREFKSMARTLSARAKDAADLAIIEALEMAMKPFVQLGVGPNVDLYAGLVYRLMGLPDDLSVAIFAVGRMPGWIAHVLEQKAENVLIRPLLEYVGPQNRPFVPISARVAAACDAAQV